MNPSKGLGCSARLVIAGCISRKGACPTPQVSTLIRSNLPSLSGRLSSAASSKMVSLASLAKRSWSNLVHSFGGNFLSSAANLFIMLLIAQFRMTRRCGSTLHWQTDGLHRQNQLNSDSNNQIINACASRPRSKTSGSKRWNASTVSWNTSQRFDYRIRQSLVFALKSLISLQTNQRDSGFLYWRGSFLAQD